MKRKPPTHRLIGCLLLLIADLGLSRPQDGVAELPSPATGKIDFAGVIAPLFSQKCHVCHRAGKQMGGLRLDTRESALRGGYSGAVIKPGDSAGSR